MSTKSTIADGLEWHLYEEMQEALSAFIESFATYITAGVLDVLTKTIEAKLMEDADKRDINPFEDK